VCVADGDVVASVYDLRVAARPIDPRTLALTLAALVAFAANSLLCRLALAPGLVDAATFTLVRIFSGALTLMVLVAATGQRRGGGSWASAMALITYAVCFSFAYLRLGAAVGALVLFGVVQLTMIGVGIARGERPGVREWGGLALALAGLVWLTRPGSSAPDPLGTALMIAAGAAWGVYSLRARGAASPLAATADNFLRALPGAAIVSLIAVGGAHATARGLVLAAASGAVASGIGYGVWYAALRGLTAARAAIVQLLVPVLASAGAVALLGERLGGRMVTAGLAIIAGVAVALVSGRR
jgi:drug/metabolite transporter (DMT)-like permease